MVVSLTSAILLRKTGYLINRIKGLFFSIEQGVQPFNSLIHPLKKNPGYLPPRGNTPILAVVMSQIIKHLPVF